MLKLPDSLLLRHWLFLSLVLQHKSFQLLVLGIFPPLLWLLFLETDALPSLPPTLDTVPPPRHLISPITQQFPAQQVLTVVGPPLPSRYLIAPIMQQVPTVFGPPTPPWHLITSITQQFPAPQVPTVFRPPPPLEGVL
jgi:hypothetical protein